MFRPPRFISKKIISNLSFLRTLVLSLCLSLSVCFSVSLYLYLSLYLSLLCLYLCLSFSPLSPSLLYTLTRITQLSHFIFTHSLTFTQTLFLYHTQTWFSLSLSLSNTLAEIQTKYICLVLFTFFNFASFFLVDHASLKNLLGLNFLTSFFWMIQKFISIKTQLNP